MHNLTLINFPIAFYRADKQCTLYKNLDIVLAPFLTLTNVSEELVVLLSLNHQVRSYLSKAVAFLVLINVQMPGFEYSILKFISDYLQKEIYLNVARKTVRFNLLIIGAIWTRCC
jgi:hypothetical protein